MVCRTPYRFQQAVPVVFKGAVDLSYEVLGMNSPAGAEVLHDCLPLAQVVCDKPVNQVGDLLGDEPRDIADDVVCKIRLDLLAVEQVEDPSQAEGLIEEGDSPIFEGV
ncbi:MAG: hypothetical protein BWY63_01937 [Chloroflexi bacterium ADurb.Bin360]|nr:MAG: hypothetical protein BWY63_01937 [Chloroflexi bacterium ADurb.Bin360]